MGVQTSADEKMDEAREHLRKAEKLLAEVIYGEVWGGAAYCQEEYREALLALAGIVDTFGRTDSD